MLKFLIPLIIFIIMVIFLAIGLGDDPRHVPSPLIDKPAPAFNLPRLYNDSTPFRPDLLKGKVWLLNAWTSDCVSCRAEHPWLMELQARNLASIVGLNYRDDNVLAKQVLDKSGNPYRAVAVDADGSVGIDYGVYAVPETFVIDKKGVIRFKHIGPINGKLLNETIVPLLSRLEQEQSE